jgi:ABC-2 type transport system ATP-binding protein
MSWGLDHVSVGFGANRALDDVTLHVETGSVTVVLGGDGAGKSTCLRALVGLIHPERGTVRRPSKERIGYVPATAGLYADLTVAENVDFWAHTYRISKDERRTADEMLERTGLAPARHRLGSQLSGGMQRKLAVGLALLHQPELLVLDEPTTGVDPVSRTDLWRLITQAAANGTAIAVATTYLNEAARAGWVMVLASGVVQASGTPSDILEGVPGRLGSTVHRPRTTAHTWRRGTAWRVWTTEEQLPTGVAAVAPDFEDAVVVAELTHLSTPQ